MGDAVAGDGAVVTARQVFPPLTSRAAVARQRRREQSNNNNGDGGRHRWGGGYDDAGFAFQPARRPVATGLAVRGDTQVLRPGSQKPQPPNYHPRGKQSRTLPLVVLATDREATPPDTVGGGTAGDGAAGGRDDVPVVARPWTAALQPRRPVGPLLRGARLAKGLDPASGQPRSPRQVARGGLTPVIVARDKAALARADSLPPVAPGLGLNDGRSSASRSVVSFSSGHAPEEGLRRVPRRPVGKSSHRRELVPDGPPHARLRRRFIQTHSGIVRPHEGVARRANHLTTVARPLVGGSLPRRRPPGSQPLVGPSLPYRAADFETLALDTLALSAQGPAEKPRRRRAGRAVDPPGRRPRVRFSSRIGASGSVCDRSSVFPSLPQLCSDCTMIVMDCCLLGLVALSAWWPLPCVMMTPARGRLALAFIYVFRKKKKPHPAFTCLSHRLPRLFPLP